MVSIERWSPDTGGIKPVRFHCSGASYNRLTALGLLASLYLLRLNTFFA